MSKYQLERLGLPAQRRPGLTRPTRAAHGPWRPVPRRAAAAARASGAQETGTARRTAGAADRDGQDRSGPGKGLAVARPGPRTSQWKPEPGPGPGAVTPEGRAGGVQPADMGEGTGCGPGRVVRRGPELEPGGRAGVGQGRARARVGEEAGGTDERAGDGEGRAWHRSSAAVARGVARVWGCCAEMRQWHRTPRLCSVLRLPVPGRMMRSHPIASHAAKPCERISQSAMSFPVRPRRFDLGFRSQRCFVRCITTLSLRLI